MPVHLHFIDCRRPRECASCELRATGRPAVRSVRRSAGLTLVELLLTVAVMAIVAAILIPHVSSDIPERLDAAAQVVSADLDYARSLAVSNNTNYRLTFEPDFNRYCLRHSGSQSALNTLPRSPFRQSDDAADQQTTRLSELPLPRPPVRLAAVIRMQSSGQATTEIEFNPLGATTATQETVVWLACGSGAQRRYKSVHVNPVTGLIEAGPLVGELPAAIATIATQNLAASEAQATAN